MEYRNSMINVQSVDGFKFKTSLYHGVRNFELIEESQANDQIDVSLDMIDLDKQTHFLGDVSRFLQP